MLSEVKCENEPLISTCAVGNKMELAMIQHFPATTILESFVVQAKKTNFTEYGLG